MPGIEDTAGKLWKTFTCDIFSPCIAVYSEVESDFHAKVPVVFCKDIKRYVSLEKDF